MELNNLRREYKKGNLTEEQVHPNPINQFKLWMQDALQFVDADPTAMILSTVSADSRPSSRIVLLKDFGVNGFTFYTNYNSRKAEEIIVNQYASILFY